MTNTPGDLVKQLQDIRAKRGYLLPHHGLMAISNPDLLEGYDQAYTALTINQRSLSRHDHEAVWLAILIVLRESLATHHLARFREAGGSDEEVSTILGLVAFLEGHSAYDFVSQYWQSQLPDWQALKSYSCAFTSMAEGVDLRLAHLCASAVHACLGQCQALAWHIKACYAESIAEQDLSEALSLMMFPGSVPRFVRASATWRQLILDGEVQASEAFQAWAEISGQGGYEEAATVTKPSGQIGLPEV